MGRFSASSYALLALDFTTSSTALCVSDTHLEFGTPPNFENTRENQ